MPMRRRRIRFVIFALPAPVTGEHDLAVVGGVEARDEIQQRGLAASRWTHDRDELTVGEPEVDAAQRPTGSESARRSCAIRTVAPVPSRSSEVRIKHVRHDGAPSFTTVRACTKPPSSSWPSAADDRIPAGRARS